VAGQSILWRRLDRPGHESGRLVGRQSAWQLSGTAVFAHTRRPCRLDYVVVCDAGWRTVSGRVSGWIGGETVEVEVSVDSARQWRLSPSTNLLPIRRLGLAVGQGAEVRAAWLGFPELTLEPLYRRIDVATYRYESAGGRFVTELEVDASGFVTRYPNFWQVEAGS